MRYTADMASDGVIYTPSFMKIDTDVQAILMFCLSNLNNYNVGIAE
jgi:hypothetical protein